MRPPFAWQRPQIATNFRIQQSLSHPTSHQQWRMMAKPRSPFHPTPQTIQSWRAPVTPLQWRSSQVPLLLLMRATAQPSQSLQSWHSADRQQETCPPLFPCQMLLGSRVISQKQLFLCQAKHMRTLQQLQKPPLQPQIHSQQHLSVLQQQQ